jgi:methyltransferase (TIGR00027 family)
MPRTDDDAWEITESVGATALGVAAARAVETRSDNPLVQDPFAAMFIDAAGEGTWSRFPQELPADADPELVEQMQLMRNYMACRTKFIDDFFLGATDAGIRQAVILAAGLDARVWRLPWPEGTVVYEIDQPKVLEFKHSTLDAHQAHPRATYIPVPVDLRHDWPKALQESGFNPELPTIWSAEGLLPFLPAKAQDLLFERVQTLSATRSGFIVEAFAKGFFNTANLDRMRAQWRKWSAEVATAGQRTFDFEELWYLEERTDVADWLATHGWDTASTPTLELLSRYGRQAPAEADNALGQSLFVAAIRR